ncbi:MAG: leucine-rich repeat domain-containing protein [Pirellulales bacterium]
MTKLNARASIIAVAALLVAQAGARQAAAVAFPDKNLETAVRALLFDKKDPAVELTEEDLRKIFILEAKGKGIKDLTGLDQCPNLQLLDLANNEVTDVAPLKDCKNLQSLDLSKNTIADIGPLAGLEALQYLELSNNQITTLPSLEALVKLSALYLSGNQIADLAPLEKLPKLTSLHLAANKITDIAPLAPLTKLSLLKLSGNCIEDISALGKLNNLSLLLLEKNKISDLAPLVESCKADAEGEKRFAPYLRLYLAGNPLSEAAKNEQVPALQGFGVKVHLEEEPPANPPADQAASGQ